MYYIYNIYISIIVIKGFSIILTLIFISVIIYQLSFDKMPQRIKHVVFKVLYAPVICSE